MTSAGSGPKSPAAARPGLLSRRDSRWLHNWKHVVLVLYLALLGASHVARKGRPDPGQRPGQLVQRVEGSPQPKRGPITIAYRQWWTDSIHNLSGNLSRPGKKRLRAFNEGCRRPWRERTRHRRCKCTGFPHSDPPVARKSRLRRGLPRPRTATGLPAAHARPRSARVRRLHHHSPRLLHPGPRGHDAPAARLARDRAGARGGVFAGRRGRAGDGPGRAGAGRVAHAALRDRGAGTRAPRRVPPQSRDPRPAALRHLGPARAGPPLRPTRRRLPQPFLRPELLRHGPAPAAGNPARLPGADAHRARRRRPPRAQGPRRRSTTASCPSPSSSCWTATTS